MSPVRVALTLWEKIDVRGPDECWPWMHAKFRGGYGATRHHGKQKKSHRVAWELTNGEIPGGLLVLHRCDNPPCCNPAHLFLGTPLDNMRDKIEKGRQRYLAGVQHHSAKLTDDDVRKIRRLYAEGERQAHLAESFRVSQSNIGRIVNRDLWRHVD